MSPQRLYHSGVPGFYINGTDASSLASPIVIPAVPSNTEFVITSEATAWGTNIQFQLKTTNDYQGTYCSATFYSPKITSATFAMSSPTNYSTVASDNYTNVSFGTTGVLAYCVADENEMPRLFVYPYQYPSQGYGIPFFTLTDWTRIGFSGTYSGTCTTNTMNARDFRSVYGVAGNTRAAGGAFFSGGQYLMRAGFDMDGDGVVDDAEVQESCKVTVFRTVFEPVTTAPQSNPVYNPSGIKVGGTATYRIDVYPASIPDSEIVWSCTNAYIAFPNGNSGRMVTVGASSEGMAKLTVDIAGYKKGPPAIWAKGLSNTTVNITFFIICDENGVPAVTPDFVTNSLARANNIYSQAAMTFGQQGAIHYITNQNWTVVEKGTFPPYWDECYEITSFTNGTGGLEVYFVNTIEGANGLYQSSGRGILVSSLASINAMAHEIGHACGLADIYVDRPGITIGTNLTCSAWLPQDWNGGPSPLYYEPGTKQELIIKRLLMHGVDSTFTTHDMPMGNIWGVKVGSGTNYTTGLTKVGLDNSGYPMNRSPASN